MNKKLLALLSLILVIALFMVGCSTTPAGITEPDASNNGDSNNADDDTVYVGISIKTLSDTYMQSLIRGLEGELKKYDNVKYDISDAQADVNTQLSQAEDLIQKGVDVLIFIPQDAEACSYIVETAQSAGVKVVEVCTETTDGKCDVYVGSDDVIAGEMLGNYVMEKLPEGGNYMILEGLMGQSSQIYRYEGLENTILKNDQYKLIDCQTANWQRDEAMKQVEDWLTKYDDIDAIICENDDMAMGALEACEAVNRKDDIIIIGVDGIEDAIRAVNDGRVDCSILQNAIAQEESAVQAAIKLANGEEVDSRIIIDFEYITKDNAQQYIDLLYAD